MERQADRTVLHLSIQGQPGNNFRIQSTTYLAGDKGKKYALTGSEGVILDQWVPFSEDVKSFDLYFEPVKGRNRALDLIEPRGWMIYGIHDADKPLKIRPAKEQEPIKDENVFFKKGTGKLNGRFEGSDHPEMIQFFGYNAFQENNLQTCKVASFANKLPADIKAIKNAIRYPFTNGPMEGCNNKVKAVKRSMYGRAKDDLLLIKITLYSRKYVYEN